MPHRLTAASVLVCVAILSPICRASNDAERSPAVEVSRDELTLPWYTSVPRYEKEPESHGAMWPQKGTKKRDGTVTFERIYLENRFLRLEILPDVGGAVGGAVYKPTGEDIFFREGKAKDWVPFWESGVKVCFPWREHCVATKGQPAGTRVIRADDGSVTVAMWMEFSRHNQPWQSAMYGRFSNLLLSQHVTLAPGGSTFTVTYRVLNPSPYRQGLRVWTDALFPRNHTARAGVVQGDAKPPGTTLTEWIFPAAYVSGHRAENIRPYRPEDNLIRTAREQHNSVFSLDMPQGFAGLWYPEVEVNRLRIWDPEKARGAKQYYRGEGSYRAKGLASHMYNFCELWGGVDNVMEGVERWLPPGRAYSFSHTYTMVRGIGKVDYANRRLAVSAEFGGDEPVLEVVTFEPVEGLRAALDGKALAGPLPCGPTRPARFDLPKEADGGTVTVTDGGGKVLATQVFPLPMPTGTDRHEEIRAASDLGSAAGSEMIGDQMDFGRTLDKAVRLYGAGSLGRGRIQYRRGKLDAAIETLTRVTEADPGEGEAWHLLGMARIEKGKSAEARKALARAVAAERPYPAARYYLAVLDLADGKAEVGLSRLQKLLVTVPDHWEARLLLAWLETGADPIEAFAQARGLVDTDPADPRALRVLQRAATETGAKDVAARARKALADICREPGADQRVAEFLAATRGEFMHPTRLKLFEK